MLKQIPFGRFTVAHGIKDYNQISPVSFDLIMQHLCRENIIRKKRKGAQGEENATNTWESGLAGLSSTGAEYP